MSDVMLHGVLNMPPNLWCGSPIDIAQRHSRYKDASQRIEQLEREVAATREQRDALAEALEELERTAGQSTLWDDPARHNARKALAAVEGGSHD